MNDSSAFFQTDAQASLTVSCALSYLQILGHEQGVTEIRIIGAALYRGHVARRNNAVISGYYNAVDAA